MSRAFVRESDDLPEKPEMPRLPAPLPPGVRNLLTPEGARRLRAQLDRLVNDERPRLIAAGEDDASRRSVRTLDLRIAHAHQCLHGAEIVPPPSEPWETVAFGATVTVRERDGGEARYRIVGFHEADMEADWVSWRSPIARALLNARLAQHVRFSVPAGEEELEILSIRYD